MIESYEQMPVGIYKTILDLIAGADELTPEDEARIVAILAGVTFDELMDMRVDAYQTMKEKASFLFKSPKAAELQRQYICGPFRLERCKRYDTMTASQFIDWNELTKAEGDNLVRQLSVVLIPEGHGYCKGYDIAEVQDAIRDHLPITDAMALMSFFLRASVRLSRPTRRSLVRTMLILRRSKTTSREAKRHATRALIGLLLAGVGLPKSMLSLHLPAALMTRYMSYQCSHFLTSSASGRIR